MTRELMFLASAAMGSTAAAMMFGAYIGRIWGRKEAHG